MNAPLLLALSLLAGPPADDDQAPARGALLGIQFDCSYSAERVGTVPASGATVARVSARAGGLRIEGRPDLTEVRVRGTACASSERYLAGVRLVVERVGDEVVVRVETPDVRGGRSYASLDLVVEVPAALALDVEDSSGDLHVRNAGALDLADSSGDIDLVEVAGPVRVRDSSGDVRIRGAGRGVVIEDSSGGIDVRTVAGPVLVEADSSGDIEIGEVDGNVVVRRDSSGSIRATGVRGDFVVERDGSGSIRYDDVAGTVRVPERRRG